MKTSSISATTRSSRLSRLVGVVAFALVAATATLSIPVQAHHSFSIFDTSKTRVFTGVVTRVNPDVNHLQIFFAVMNDERTNVNRDAKTQPIVWAVEMAGSAQAAQQGITVNAFAPGTIISLALHPLRDGTPGGNREGSMFKCPAKTPPKAGKHCDSVEGSQSFGNGPLPTPTS